MKARVSWLARFRILRFGLVGAVVGVIYVALYIPLIELGLARVWANAFAFGLAVAAQYVGQTLFTFRRRLLVPGQALRFLLMIGMGLGTSAVITSWIAPRVGLPDLAAAIAVALVLPLQNYLLMRAWVYARPSTCPEI